MEVTTRYWLLERSTWKWFLLALLVRGGWFWVFVHAHGLHHGAWGWGATTGDTWSYFDPIDSYLAGNAYRPDLRMPGYGVVYLFFRWFTTVPGAGSMVILVQLFFSALSCSALHRIGGLIGLRRGISIALTACYALLPRVAMYDVMFITESFCLSALLLALLGWLLCVRSPTPINLAAAGGLISWVVFLRPALGVFLPVLTIALGACLKAPAMRRLRAVFLFLLPFLLLDSAWTSRNWIVHHRFRPLANRLYYPSLAETPLFHAGRYVRAYGGDHTWWSPSADVRWFIQHDGTYHAPHPRYTQRIELPSAATSEHVTLDSLRLMAAAIGSWRNARDRPLERWHIALAVHARADRFIAAYAADRPINYHLVSRVRMLAHQLDPAGLDPLFGAHFRKPPPYAPIVVGCNGLLYWSMIPLGLMAAVLALLTWRRWPREVVVIAALVLVGVLEHPILRRSECRYLVPMYPFLCIMAAWLVDRWLIMWRQRHA